MRIRTLVGAYAGTIRDFPVPVARAMLADGRAEPLEQRPDAPTEVPPPSVATEKAMDLPRRKRRKKW